MDKFPFNVRSTFLQPTDNTIKAETFILQTIFHSRTRYEIAIINKRSEKLLEVIWREANAEKEVWSVPNIDLRMMAVASAKMNVIFMVCTGIAVLWSNIALSLQNKIQKYNIFPYITIPVNIALCLISETVTQWRLCFFERNFMFNCVGNQVVLLNLNKPLFRQIFLGIYNSL